MTLFLGEGRDLAVKGFALDDDERVNILDRCTVVGREAEHVVEHNGTVGKRLGCNEQSLAQGTLREGGKHLGEFRLDVVGSDDYITRGKSEDGLVGKDGEALIARCGRCVEL